MNASAPLLRSLLPVLLLSAPAVAAAQGQAYPPSPSGSGLLPWVFAGFAVVTLVVLFLVVLWLRRPPERPPFNKPRA